jgi:hypothetical protein
VFFVYFVVQSFDPAMRIAGEKTRPAIAGLVVLQDAFLGMR